ncbi:MAG: hypothetical protein NXI27_17385 [Alphaproteobacteria bacterium]|nr:hypothetical protein [Alphaproteobacteria bacterium]
MVEENWQSDPRKGARSLITEAIGARSGDTLAIIAEDAGLGIYDAMVPVCVADVAGELGIAATIIPVGDHAGLSDIPKPVLDALETATHVLFHARLGDTLRFDTIPGKASVTMSYALDLSVLGGPACTIPHGVMREIQTAYDAVVDRAETWRICCPLGTDISGTQDLDKIAAGDAEDFTVIRYPVCAPRPISCKTANGVVAVTHWLMASGNQKYDDDELLLPEIVLAEIENGRVVDFKGPAEQIARMRTHGERVGRQFGIDPWIVHSWHAGINPGAFYPVEATVDLERWGKVAFANPRYLHFHTCGAYAPGEIAWTLFDASAEFDGRPIWIDGNFVFVDDPEVKTILSAHQLASLPIRQDIGIP